MRVKCLAQEHNAVPRPRLEPGPLDPESSALTISHSQSNHLALLNSVRRRILIKGMLKSSVVVLIVAFRIFFKNVVHLSSILTESRHAQTPLIALRSHFLISALLNILSRESAMHIVSAS